jgi:hypothetical protein
VVEVFANGRVALTARLYPTRSDSTGIEVITAMPPGPEDLAVWELRSARRSAGRDDGGHA